MVSRQKIFEVVTDVPHFGGKKLGVVSDAAQYGKKETGGTLWREKNRSVQRAAYYGT